jgi:hypothetical protein
MILIPPEERAYNRRSGEMATHYPLSSADDNSIPQVGADGNGPAQDVTELSQSGRKWYISDSAEEKSDLRERVIPEIVEKHKKFVDYEVAGDLAYAMTDREDPFLQREYGDRLGVYAQTGDIARSLVYNTDLYSNIRDEIVGYGYDLDETDNLAIAEQRYATQQKLPC